MVTAENKTILLNVVTRNTYHSIPLQEPADLQLLDPIHSHAISPDCSFIRRLSSANGQRR
jgi:hypothetical protein